MCVGTPWECFLPPFQPAVAQIMDILLRDFIPARIVELIFKGQVDGGKFCFLLGAKSDWENR